MLTRTSEYALRALVYLTQNERDWPIPGRVIAERTGIPAHYLSKILRDLVRSGILESSPGKAGGFRPRMPPTQTMLCDVLCSFEQFGHQRCPFSSNECSDETPCHAHARWKEVMEAKDRFLRETSVHDVSVASPGDGTAAEYDG